MLDFFRALFSFELLIRAAIVGTLVSLCCALLGTSLVLKRYSMIGDGLSHVAFGTVSVALAFGAAPMIVTLPVVIIAAFLLLRVSDNGKVKGDAAIAMISGVSLALGVVILKICGGSNVDINGYMFGNILLISKSDLFICVPLALIVIILFTIFYNAVFSVTFDENFALSSGMNVSFYKTVLAVLTAVTVVVGIRLMGALLISSLIIFPTLSSMQIFKKYKSVVLFSSALSVVCYFAGLYLTYTFDIPTGAGIVLVNFIAFAICFLLKKTVKRR